MRLPLSVPGPVQWSLNHVNGSTGRQRQSRVPYLLVGGGMGYWLTWLLYLLGCSWHQGCWARAPLAMAIVGSVLLALTFLLGVFSVADSNIHGTGVERVLKPVADSLGDNTRVLHWKMVTGAS